MPKADCLRSGEIERYFERSQTSEAKSSLWAGDHSPDSFRIKIWWEDAAGEHVVDDNGAQQAIAGGSIVVHTK